MMVLAGLAGHAISLRWIGRLLIPSIYFLSLKFLAIALKLSPGFIRKVFEKWCFLGAGPVQDILGGRGLAGLLWSGLPAKLLCNGVSSVVFSVAWKMLMDRQADRSRHAPRHTKDDDDGDVEGGAPLLAGNSRV